MRLLLPSESKGMRQINGTPGSDKEHYKDNQPQQDGLFSFLLFLLDVIYQISNALSNWLDL